MALQDQEIVLEIKQEPSWQSEYGSNQEGYEMGFKEGEERSSRSPDSQGTENIEMEELDNESATVEDLGEEWCEDETGNLCDPLCHMSSDVLGSPESSDGGDAGSYSSKRKRPVAPTRSGRGTAPRVSQISQVLPRRILRKRSLGRMDDGEQVYYDFEEQEEEGTDDLPDPSIAVPPPRITHIPRVIGGPVEIPQTYQLETFSPNFSPNFSPKGRKKRRPNTVPFLFTPEEEKELAEWYRDNPRFYNKRCRDFRLTHVKRRMLENKAHEYVDCEGNECSFLQLSTWMSNMRTYYGKLGNLPNTGYRASDHKLTERELWIKSTFSFLSDHIVRIKCRKGVTLGKHGRSKTDGRTGSRAGSHTSSQAESITSDAGEDDLQVMHPEATVVDTKPGTSTGGATPQGKGDRAGTMPGIKTESSPVEKMDPVKRMDLVEKMDPVENQVEKMEPEEKMDIKTIERICARIVEKGPVQPTAAPDSPHSAELNDFARTIVSSMRRIPEVRWNDVKTDIMLVVRNYSTSAHTNATPPMPAPATQYPMGYWPPAPPAHAPPYNPNAIPGYSYPAAPGHGYYGPPPAPSTGPPLYPPGPPHMHPAMQQGPQFMQAGVVAAPISTASATTTATSTATTATSSAANTSGS
ncbi:uncharacterized protein LOC588106 isoform X2 [Strongylocentrotus purpuratus]|uniref:Uncharacterized protein n=1 Tax=Strongylocentrotus purpuratus TaxID=7668 RepID=A0A7M7RE38_STRPU|nr:uncharacterized protein LOC588106 isoform X2 [Strongylocentrotus purpuratus]